MQRVAAYCIRYCNRTANIPLSSRISLVAALTTERVSGSIVIVRIDTATASPSMKLTARRRTVGLYNVH